MQKESTKRKPFGVFAIAVMVVAVLVSSPAFAEGSLPQLNVATFPSQLFWLAVCFVLLLLLAKGLLLPRVSGAIQTRGDKIKNDIEQADEISAQARELIVSYEKALLQARSRGQSLLSTRVMEANKHFNEAMTSQASDIVRRTNEAEHRILKERNSVLARLEDDAYVLVQECMKHFTGSEIAIDDAKKAVHMAKEGEAL